MGERARHRNKEQDLGNLTRLVDLDSVENILNLVALNSAEIQRHPYSTSHRQDNIQDRKH